jgi:hypothetical protein
MIVYKKLKLGQQEYLLYKFKAINDFCILIISKTPLLIPIKICHPIDSYNSLKKLVSNSEDIYTLALVKEPLMIAFLNEISEILQSIKTTLYFIYLLKYKLPPLINFDLEEEVDCFMCPVSLLDKFNNDKLNDLCYKLSNGILNNKISVDEIYAIQVGKNSFHSNDNQEKEALVSTKNVSLMIPHAGNIDFLKTCLKYVQTQTERIKDINICFDDNSFLGLDTRFKSDPFIKFWQNIPQNVGPYYPRDYIFQIVNSDYVVFQDSDDVPTSNRVEMLIDEINKNPDTGMIGSHSLEVDELEEKIYGWRYPLDVNKAHQIKSGYSLFHPTTIINKNAYLKSGGFTKWRKFASDAQYTFKASTCMKIRNSDNFLYIKRTRKDSLMTAPKTHSNSKIRKFFLRIWCRDITLILDGKLDIDSSSFNEKELEPEAYFTLREI